MLNICYSNQIETLYGQLKKNLFTATAPFCRRLIVVSTPAIKSWLTLRMAQDPDLDIAAGIEILYLEDSLKKLRELTQKKASHSHDPSRLELTLAIDSTIRKAAYSWDHLDTPTKEAWLPLFNYLKVIPPASSFSRRSDKRLAAMAENLATLFMDYGKYGQAMVDGWKGTVRPDWQQMIWQQLFSAGNRGWSFTSLEYKTLELKNNDAFDQIQVYLFSISFLSPAEQACLQKISALIPLHYYLLSPCRLFWTDLLSDKEAQRLQRFWSNKNVSAEEQRELENYLRDKNSLLANWGKLGRKMTEMLEAQDGRIFEDYQLPAPLDHLAPYNAFDTENVAPADVGQNYTLLTGVQTDILLLRNPLENGNVSIPLDRSIQLHCAPSKQREIQILYHNLLALIKESPGIQPSDIIVMAPDIREYAPYIPHYFGVKGSLLDFHLMDMHAATQDSLTQQLLHLIHIPFGRWDIEELLILFRFPSFQKRNQLSHEDLQCIHGWLEEAGVLWGESPHHRNEILKLRYTKGMADPCERGTWDEGFSRLLSGLVLKESDGPSISIEFSQAPLLGKLIFLIRQLKEDLKPLSNGTQLTYGDWTNLLKKLMEKYLFEASYQEEDDELLDILDQIALAARWIPDQKISFTAFKKHLESNLNNKTFIYRESHLQTVRFCSMLPMRAIPAKVIALIGMEEGAFPRIDKPSSLNLMKGNPLCDYCPSRTDFDRYLFLETLLSARKHLLLSYAAYAADGKEQEPSLMVTELLNYMDEAFEIPEGKVSTAITFRHPYNPFDALYFSEGSGYHNFSPSDYRAAISHYRQKKAAPHRFIHDFFPATPIDDQENEVLVEIQKLKTAIQNPIKSYFNKTLGIWIKEEQQIQTEESFEVNHLQMYAIRKASLKGDLRQTLEQAEKQGVLPLGLFKQQAQNNIEVELEKYGKHLEKLNIDKNQIFEIRLHEQYSQPIKDEEGWKLPPLEIRSKEQKTFRIVGKIADVSEQGLIVHEDQKSEPTKIWAEYVILNYLIDCYGLPIQKQLLCTKDGKIRTLKIEDSLQELHRLLDYYLHSLSNISPLSKEWLHDLIHQTPEDFEKAIQDGLEDSFSPIHNEYLKWTCRSTTPDTANIITHWQPKAKELFSHLYEQWSAKT